MKDICFVVRQLGQTQSIVRDMIYTGRRHEHEGHLLVVRHQHGHQADGQEHEGRLHVHALLVGQLGDRHRTSSGT